MIGEFSNYDIFLGYLFLRRSHLRATVRGMFMIYFGCGILGSVGKVIVEEINNRFSVIV